MLDEFQIYFSILFVYKKSPSCVYTLFRRQIFIMELFFRVCVDGLPCRIYGATYYKSLLYWPFFIKWESKDRADLQGRLGVNDKTTLARKDCQGTCQTGIKQPMLKKVVSYCCGQTISCSLPYTGLLLLTSSVQCVLAVLYVALFWPDGYCG